MSKETKLKIVNNLKRLKLTHLKMYRFRENKLGARQIKYNFFRHFQA